MITIVKPKFEILGVTEGMAELLEVAGRVCWKSEDKTGPGTAEKMMRDLIKRTHVSVIEHGTITAKFTGSRAMSHQLVRHRIAAISQESQRYCNYGKSGLKVVTPPPLSYVLPGQYEDNGSYWLFHKKVITNATLSAWLNTVGGCYDEYLQELENGWKPEDARYVLPNATKTEVVVTYNLRTWRHVFRERALNPAAQHEIRHLFLEGIRQIGDLFPWLTEDL